MFVGFDSKLIAYEIIEPLSPPPEGVPYEHYEPIPKDKGFKRVFKFLLGASISTKDRDRFKDVYIESLKKSIEASGFASNHIIYDSNLLVSESGYKMTEVVPRFLNLLCNEIVKIDLYCAYYTHPMTLYGETQRHTIYPIKFLHIIDSSFPHICASKYVREYGIEMDDTLELDHFQLGKTPAWEHLESSECKIKLYFSGDMCNPLISTADLIIRLIEERLEDRVDETSTKKALIKGCEILSKNIKFYPLGRDTEEKRYATPRLTLHANVNHLIKHPIIFTLGRRPELFYDTPTFKGMQKKALNEDGCIKKYRSEDRTYWNISKDIIVPLDEEEEKKLKELQSLGVQLPKFVPPTEFF